MCAIIEKATEGQLSKHAASTPYPPPVQNNTHLPLQPPHPPAQALCIWRGTPAASQTLVQWAQPGWWAARGVRTPPPWTPPWESAQVGGSAAWAPRAAAPAPPAGAPAQAPQRAPAAEGRHSAEDAVSSNMGLGRGMMCWRRVWDVWHCARQPEFGAWDAVSGSTCLHTNTHATRTY